MARRAFFLLLVAAVFLANPVWGQDRMSSRDADKLVAEFCEREIIDERRAEIVTALRNAPAARIILPLRRQLESDKFGPQICHLIRELKHPRTWDIVGGYLDGPFGDLALELLFQVGGEHVMTNLQNRWRTADASSLMFELLTDGFVDYAPDVTYFVQHVSDTDKGEAARQIVVRALHLPADTPADKLAATWAQYTRTFEMRGKAILAEGKFDINPVRKFGDNIFMPQNQRVLFTDFEAMQRRDHTVFVRFKVLNVGGANGPRFGYQTDQGAWAFDVQEAKLAMRTSRGSEALPLNADDWNALTFIVRMNRDRQTRSMWVSLNGTRYNSNNPLPFNGAIQAIFARANDGQLVIGSWDLVEN